MQINLGDIVMLKSGSFPMTVTEMNNETVTCKWYCGQEHKFKIEDFNPHTLEKKK
jgi:uncharacterized protein YodC (DUF2158 family)